MQTAVKEGTRGAGLILLTLFVFLAFATLYPNPYGENPDVIVDESYFLTSSLSALEKGTLPGWEFSASGAYYGGVQSYIDAAALAPALAVVLVAEHGSLAATETWVALHTGTLLHILRLVNGALGLLTLALCYWYARRRDIPRSLTLLLALYAGLLLSNVMVVEFFHTAKMWPIYIIVVAVGSALFVAQEYYLRRLGRPFLAAPAYAAVMLALGTLAFFQNYFGVCTFAFLALYALYLGHLAWRDALNCLRRYWLWVLLAAATQLSFLWRAAHMGPAGSIANLSAEQGNHIDWPTRLVQPILDAFSAQPLMALYLVLLAVLGGIFLTRRAFFADSARRRLLAVAALNPVLTWLVYHVIIGFSSAPRYGILLSMACAFSIVLILFEFPRHYTVAAFVGSAALALVICVHAIALYWHPSSEARLEQWIVAQHNVPSNLFIVDPGAIRLTLPMNAGSLALLDARRASFSRYGFLAAHPDLLARMSSFEPFSLIAYSPEEEQDALARFATSSDAIWLITTDCRQICTVAERASGSCWDVNLGACGYSPQEVNGLVQFLSATQVGDAFVVRRVK